MRFWFLLLCCASICGTEFTPWWTGSLLSLPGRTVDKGKTNIQPYIFYTESRGFYNSDWHLHRTNTTSQIQIQNLYTRGLTTYMDMQFIPQMFINWDGSNHATRLGDLPLLFGFQLMKQEKGSWRPDIRLTLNETFPTGNYQRLNPGKNGLDSTGSGSFQTGLACIIQKNIHLWNKHYLRYRLNFVYTLPSPVAVEGFNAYGGGFGTVGTVYPGQIYMALLAFEFNFNQNFVFAIDLMNVYTDRTKFSGKTGYDRNGNPAKVGLGSSDILSLAPALEWNFNENWGIIGGVWFSLKGRNTDEFTSYVLSLNVIY